MEFLRSFLGRHLVGKPMVASGNVRSAVFSRYVTDWIDKARKFFLPIQNSIKNDTTWKSIVS